MTTKQPHVLTDETEAYDIDASDQQPTSTALIPFVQPVQDVEPIHGVVIPGTASFQQKLAMTQAISQVRDGKSDKIDDYINRVLWVTGVLQHDVMVNNSANSVDRTTGEVPEYVNAVRSIMLVVGVDNERFATPMKMHVTSIAATRYFQQNILPVFGPMFEQPIPMRFRIVATQKGRTYNIEIPQGVTF